VRRYARTLGIIIVLVVASLLILGFQTFKIGNFIRGGDTPLGLTLGLDLQGGSHLVYQASLTDEATGQPIIPTADQMEALKKTIERRVNSSGLGEPNIQILGDDRLLIQMPGVTDPDRAKQLIGETARLEFRHRQLEVARAIAGLTQEDIVAVRVVDAAAPVATTTTSVESATSTDSNATSTDSTATSTEPVITTPPVPEPRLEIDFTEAGATAFAAALAEMVRSLEIVPGNPSVYPTQLTIAVEGSDQPALNIPSSRVLIQPGGFSIPLGGDPYIRRVPNTNTFRVNLIAGLTDMTEAQQRFGNNPTLNLGLLMGKLDESVGLTGDDLSRAYPGQHAQTNRPIVNIEFTPDGAKKFAEITGRIAGTQDLLAIYLDEEELIAPSVNQAITGGSAFIEGQDFTIQRVRDIALLLESGRLPIPINLIQEREVDAILGKDSLEKSLVAGWVGLALVMLFMVLYYRVPGFVASLALVVYTILLLAIFKLFNVTLTLSGVAATILSIGMAVDANVLIFERMKEELRAGRTMLAAINIGFNRAWSAILDSNVSTLITCAILYWFGDALAAPLVMGFALNLAIGVALSMFTAVIVSRTFMRFIVATPLGKKYGLFVPSAAKQLPQNQKPAAAADARS